MDDVKTFMNGPRAGDVGPARPGWGEDARIAPDLRTQWVADGYVILKSIYSRNAIEEYNRVVAAERAVIPDGKDAHGFGDRIGQLHQKHPSLLKLASDRGAIDFLSWAFDDEPVVFGSLNFEHGTQQDAHIDAIFFYPEPIYSMAGVWVALEDVHPEAGPLFYIPGSHRWPFFHSEDVVRTRPNLNDRRELARSGASAAETGNIVSDLGLAWTDDLRDLQKQYDARQVTLPVRAGDVVVWHSLLARGGSPRLDLTRSRRSVVFHFIGAHTSLYSTQQFFLKNRDELPNEPAQLMTLKYYGDVRYMSYPYYVSYLNGQEIIHHL